MRKTTRGQANAWTFAFETLTVAATISFLIGIRILWPGVLTPNRLVPRGTVLTVQLDGPISSRTAHLGDQFYGHILSAQGGGELALSLAGVQVVGRCVAARDRQIGVEPGYLRLALSGLIGSDGQIAPLDTSTVSFWGERVMSSEMAAGFVHGVALTSAADVTGSEDAVAVPERQLSFVILRPAVAPRP